MPLRDRRASGFRPADATDNGGDLPLRKPANGSADAADDRLANGFYAGSTRLTVPTLSIARSKDATAPTPLVSALATR